MNDKEKYKAILKINTEVQRYPRESWDNLNRYNDGEKLDAIIEINTKAWHDIKKILEE